MSGPTYDVHPGVAMVKKWTDELPAKTGHTLDEWADLVRRDGPADRKSRVAWLKQKHGFGTNAAGWIAEYAHDSATWDGDPVIYLEQAPRYVDGMFAGGKADLRPIFEMLVIEVRKLGPDVRVCPCKTIVPFYRARVFAQAKPATKTRLELALALPDPPAKGRLKPNPRAKGNDRLKHLFELATVTDIDAEVRKWLKTAYEADG